MARKSFFEIVEYIKAFSNAHTQLKKVGADFAEQIDGILTETEKYPAFFIVPRSSEIGESLNTWDLDIYCVDIIQKGRENIVNIISETALILNDLHLFLTDGDNWDFEGELITPIEQVNNFAVDYLAGNVGTFRITVESYGVCEVPMGTVVPPSKNCLPSIINLKGFDGVLIVSIETDSGEEVDFNLILTDSDGTEIEPVETVVGLNNATIKAPNSAYTVEYENGTLIESGEILSNGFELIKVPNPTTCSNAVVNINSLLFGTVASGGSINVPVVNTENTALGSIVGSDFIIQDTTYNIYVNGVLNQSVTIPTLKNETLNITA